MARKSKLNDDVQKTLIELIGDGVTVEDACAAVGIGERTFYDWMERGEAGSKPYAQFAHAINRARNAAKVAAISTIRRAMKPRVERKVVTETFVETRVTKSGQPYEYRRETKTVTAIHMLGDWRAALEYLKRRYPGEWGDRINTDDWRTQAIADIRAGRVTYNMLAEALDDSLAAELFRSAGVAIASEG